MIIRLRALLAMLLLLSGCGLTSLARPERVGQASQSTGRLNSKGLPITLYCGLLDTDLGTLRKDMAEFSEERDSLERDVKEYGSRSPSGRGDKLDPKGKEVVGDKFDSVVRYLQDEKRILSESVPQNMQNIATGANAKSAEETKALRETISQYAAALDAVAEYYQRERAWFLDDGDRPGDSPKEPVLDQLLPPINQFKDNACR